MTINFSYKQYEGERNLRLLTTKNTPHVDDMGEYYHIKTLNRVFSFNVDNIQKTLEVVEKDSDKCCILDILHFRLWEEFYHDTILPGKIEKIHKKTLVRAIEYTRLPHAKVYNICDYDSIKSLLDADTSHHPIHVIYDLNPYMMSRIENIAHALLGKDDAVTFEPHFEFKLTNLEYTEIKRSDNMVIDTSNHGWVVFSKTHKNSLFFVDDYNHACMMLAALKFGSSIPYFTCGVSLFEDYYFMPLMYNTLHIDDGDEVIMVDYKFF